MPAVDWLALLFLAVAISGGIVLLVVRGLRAWRTFRAFNSAAGTAMDGVLTAAAAAEARAGAVDAGSERLAAATARLQESLAQLATLRAALDEPRQLVRRARGAVPHK